MSDQPSSGHIATEPAIRSGPPATPRATYRLQLQQDFGFNDVTALAPYLQELGISHVYASPFLMARPGSTHGYDITDHNRLNPEIGDEQSFAEMTDTLRRLGIGLILDFVPNHMGVGGADNPWWLDVLEWGQASPYAGFFDIDWEPAEPTLKGKVLLPFLGDHYGKVLEGGHLKLDFDFQRGDFTVRYYEHVFPVAVRDYPALLRRVGESSSATAELLSPIIGELATLRPDRRSVSKQAMVERRAREMKLRLAELVAEQPALAEALRAVADAYSGNPGDPASFRDLHRLLERQAYRIAFWRVATAEINYRRFFDINHLAGLRIEETKLFEISHRLLFRYIAEGRVQGIRLDHVDGLYDPEAYCRELQERAAYLTLPGNDPDGQGVPSGPDSREHPFYILVEKILARHERLRTEWPIDGTTGYEFMNLVNGLFVNPAAENTMTRIYHRFIGREPDFEEIATSAKREMVETNLASELNVLASNLHQLARQNLRTRDFTLAGIRDALVAVITHFPVYRTYITERGISELDRRDLDWAFSRARKASAPADPSVFEFLYLVLSTDLRKRTGLGYRRAEILRTAMKFQQYTGPVMAKSIEDTAFYRYCRLISLNEVGGEPTRFGISPSAFHRLNQDRLRNHPHTMLATATHDHKRGEDVRCRISALSEMPTEWRRRVQRWAQLNRSKKGQVEGTHGPGRNDEYLFYQTLVGAWPLDLDTPDGPALTAYADRLVAYMTKAMREAKRHTSWAYPNADYESAVEIFVRAVLNPERSKAFVSDVLRFQSRLAVIGAVNGLAQTLLKLTVPGVPDIYQGCEFWDLSLVDPDNRRPVDFEDRAASLAADPHAPLSALLPEWRNGRAKQHLMARVLRFRRDNPVLFDHGDYIPLDVSGSQSDRVVAFARRLGEEWAIIVAPHLPLALLGDEEIPLPQAAAWGGTSIAMADLASSGRWRNIFTGAQVDSASSQRVGDLLHAFPVCLLTQDTGNV